MRCIKFISISLAVLLPAISGFAADDLFPEFFCAPAKTIQPPSEYCEDNNIFTQSAELCLKRLKFEVSKEGEAVKRFFSKKSGGKQSEDFNQSSYDHVQASNRLARLIRLAKKTATEIDTYFDAVYYPIDYDSPDVNGGDPEKYVLSKPCYGDTVKALDSIIDDVEKVGDELIQAKGVADSISSRLIASEAKIKNSSGQKLVKAAPGKAGSPVIVYPKGKRDPASSTITGEIRPKVDLSKNPAAGLKKGTKK